MTKSIPAAIRYGADDLVVTAMVAGRRAAKKCWRFDQGAVMTHFILASSQACIGCRTCEVACALEHVAEGAEFHPRLKVMRLDTLSVR